MTLFTIGFTQKSAKQLFDLLKKNHIKRIIDIRLHNNNQLAGYTKKDDFEYFLKEIANINYKYIKEMAPTEELMKAIREKQISIEEFKKQFLKILKERKIEKALSKEEIDMSCLLCSEAKAEDCHRSVVSEYLRSKYKEIEIINI
jgi:uncharacterized protein (DUF488 family)